MFPMHPASWPGQRRVADAHRGIFLSNSCDLTILPQVCQASAPRSLCLQRPARRLRAETPSPHAIHPHPGQPAPIIPGRPACGHPGLAPLSGRRPKHADSPRRARVATRPGDCRTEPVCRRCILTRRPQPASSWQACACEGVHTAGCKSPSGGTFTRLQPKATASWQHEVGSCRR